MEEYFANYGLINESTYHYSKYGDFQAGFAVIQFLSSASVIKCLQEEKHTIKNFGNVNVRRLISNEELIKRKRECLENDESKGIIMIFNINFLDNTNPIAKRPLLSVQEPVSMSNTAKSLFFIIIIRVTL